ncbi:hypothetical protein CYY_006772 [Polysphondylium violaceum]|uniref:Importin subunit alpha n=1 Tax=Polysphondylium violaceum TaxID=133409 RepID=A0A8J4PRZ2_9MYCE|nr:hypothetical protein CYY_006772 [Polysphondylium violaceum]
MNSTIEKINSNELEVIQTGLNDLHRLVSVQIDPPIKQVLDLNIIPKIISFLKHDNDQIKYNAILVLNSLSRAKNSKVISTFLKSDILGPIEELLSNNYNNQKDLKEQLVEIITNIVKKDRDSRYQVLHFNNIVSIIAANIKNGQVKSHSVSTKCIAALSCTKPPPDHFYTAQFLSYLAKYLELYNNNTADFAAENNQKQQDECLADTLKSLSFISDNEHNSDPIVDIVNAHRCVLNLVKLLHHSSDNIVKVALRILGNLITGDEECTQKVMDSPHFLESLKNLLSHPTKATRKEVIWILSNTLADSPHQIQMVIDAGFVPLIIDMVYTEGGSIIKECNWVLLNIVTQGNQQQIQYSLDQGFLKALCAIITKLMHFVGNFENHEEVEEEEDEEGLPSNMIFPMAFDAFELLIKQSSNNPQEPSVINNIYLDETLRLEYQTLLTNFSNSDNYGLETRTRATQLLSSYFN